MDPQRRFLNKFLDEVLAGVAGAEEEEGGGGEGVGDNRTPAGCARGCKFGCVGQHCTGGRG